MTLKPRIKNLYRLLPAFLLILLIGMVLLYSDRHNRVGKTSDNREYIADSLRQVKAEKGKTYHIVIIGTQDNKEKETLLGFWEKLRQWGYVKDSNLKVTFHQLPRDPRALSSLMGKLNIENPDLFVAISSGASQAAARYLHDKPVVYIRFDEYPVDGDAREDLIDAGAMTGVTQVMPLEETMALLVNSGTEVKKIATLFSDSDTLTRQLVEEGKRLLSRLTSWDMPWHVPTGKPWHVPTGKPGDETSLMIKDLLENDPDVIWIPPNAVSDEVAAEVIRQASLRHCGVVVQESNHYTSGAIAAVLPRLYPLGIRAAYLTAKLLRGEKVRDVPPETCKSFEISINYKLAAELKVHYPDTLKRLAEYGVTQFKPGRKLHFALIQYNDAPISEESREGILLGFKELGLEENKDFDLVALNAQGDVGMLNTMVMKISKDQYDIVFVTSTPTLQLAVQKLTNSPVVFTCVADPMKAGAGENFEHHHANITGISTYGDFKGGLDCFMKIMPGLKRIGTLYTPGETNSVNNLKAFTEFATSKNIEVITVPISNSSDVADAAIALTSKRLDAVCQIIDNLTSSSFSSIYKAAYDKRLPIFGFVSDQVNKGAIAGVSRDYIQGGKDAVHMAVRILRGENPADIPFRFVRHSLVYVNPASAAYFKVSIPPEVLQHAIIVK